MRSRRHSLKRDHQHEGADQHRRDQQEHAAVDAAEEQDAHRDRGDHHEGAHVGLGQQEHARPPPSATAIGMTALHRSSPSRPSCAPCSWPHRARSPAWPARTAGSSSTPSGIQRRAPLTPLPMNGISTSTSRQQGADEDPRRALLPELHRDLHRDERGHEGQRQREHVAGQEMGRRVARETAGCRASPPRPNTPSPARARARRCTTHKQRLVEALRRPAGRLETQSRTGRSCSPWQRAGSRPGRARELRERSSAASCDTSIRQYGRDRAPARSAEALMQAAPHARPPSPAPRPRRPRRGARSCGTCRGWRRPGSAAPRRPRRRLLGAPARGRSQRVEDCIAHAGGGERGSMAGRRVPISAATARAWRDSGSASGAKSWPLPSPPRITTSWRGATVGAQAVERRHRGADVRALAVVEDIDALHRRDELHAVRLAAVFAQAVQHRRQRAADGRGQRQRGQRIGRVVAAAHVQAHRPASGAGCAAPQARLPCAGACAQRLVGSACARTSQAMPFSTTMPKSPGRCGASSPKRITRALDRLGMASLLRHGRGHHRLDQRVVAVDDHHRVLAEDARLGRGVGIHRAVPVEMVLRDVEHGRGAGLEAVHGVELEARQLQHPDLGQVLEHRLRRWRRHDRDQRSLVGLRGRCASSMSAAGGSASSSSVDRSRRPALPPAHRDPPARNPATNIRSQQQRMMFARRLPAFGLRLRLGLRASTSACASGSRSSASASVCSMVGPMLPAIATRLPARSTSSAVIAVVVVLPLVPVIASTFGA